MLSAKAILFSLVFVVCSFAVRNACAADDNFSSSPIAPSQTSIIVRKVAMALAGNAEAVRGLHGAPYEEDNRDRLEPPIPGMICGIDRILNYVSCYTAAINNQAEAESIFSRLDNEVQAALPSGSWRRVPATPTVGAVRSLSYADGHTGAQIDIELVAEPALDIHSYVISLYGWAKT